MRGSEGERAGPREKGGLSGVRGAEMAHARERRERMEVRGGKTVRERGRWGPRGSKRPKGGARGRGGG